jgi:hypothetical protein
MIRPFSGKRVIVVAVRQRYISSEQIDDLHQDSIKGFAVPPQFFPLVVALEATGIKRGQVSV